jgi:ABC-type uncharacterized transport system permease subunit
MLACLLFGFADALTIQLQGVPVSATVLRLAILLVCALLGWFILYQFRFIKSRIIRISSGIAIGIAIGISIIYYSTRGLILVEVPVQFIQMIPYLVTIVVLAGFIGQSRAPKALGTPYQKEK